MTIIDVIKQVEEAKTQKTAGLMGQIIEVEVDDKIKLSVLHEDDVFSIAINFKAYDEKAKKYLDDEEKREWAQNLLSEKFNSTIETCETDLVDQDVEFYLNENFHASLFPSFKQIFRKFNEDEKGWTLGCTIVDIVDTGREIQFYSVLNEYPSMDNIYRTKWSYSKYNQERKKSFVMPANRIKVYQRFEEAFGKSLEYTPGNGVNQEALKSVIGKEVEIEVKSGFGVLYGQMKVVKRRA